MNTGLLRHAVATVLTVYGIETTIQFGNYSNTIFGLQQCLPFTVLKRSPQSLSRPSVLIVATVLTVYGIETNNKYERVERIRVLQQCLPFTVLKL